MTLDAALRQKAALAEEAKQKEAVAGAQRSSMASVATERGQAEANDKLAQAEKERDEILKTLTTVVAVQAGNATLAETIAQVRAQAFARSAKESAAAQTRILVDDLDNRTQSLEIEATINQREVTRFRLGWGSYLTTCRRISIRM